jgi:hypothetical protein
MGGFSLITLAALVTVGGFVVRLDHTGPELIAPAALSSQVNDAMLTDAATGLSYALLGDPWHDGGCPGAPPTEEFRWTGGEQAVAGTLSDGADWYGDACSGPLPQRLRGEGLALAAWNLADAIEGVYYSALPHSVTVVRSAPVQVGGRSGWLAEFLVRYSGLPQLAWSSELAAVVVTNNAAFYVSVPDNLGTGLVATLLGSLR